MKIQFILDTEDRLDPSEPLGKIEIFGNDGSSIKEEVIFVDSVLFAIANGLLEIDNQSTFSSEIIDEPNPLNFVKKENEYQIEYMGSSISFFSLSEAIKELIKNVHELKLAFFKPGSPEFDSYFDEFDDIIHKLKSKL